MTKLNLDYLETFIYKGSNVPKDGKKIIFIHGFFTDHRCFEPLYLKLQEKYECICFNLPGCGSEKMKNYPLSYLHLETMSELIAKYIIVHDLKDIILIGHSLGAAIGTMVVNILKNNRVSRLILLAPFNITSLPKIINKPLRFKSLNNQKQFDELQKIVFNDYSKAIHFFDEQKYYDGMIDFYNRNHKYSLFIMINMVQIWTLKNLNNAYKNLNVSTIVFMAGKDEFVSLENTIDYLSKFHKNIKIVQYLEAGHAFYIEEFERFYKDITFIIESVSDKEKIKIEDFSKNQIPKIKKSQSNFNDVKNIENANMNFELIDFDKVQDLKNYQMNKTFEEVQEFEKWIEEMFVPKKASQMKNDKPKK